MGVSRPTSPEPVPISVGYPARALPGPEGEFDPDDGWLAQRQPPSELKDSDIAWSSHGFEPRWLGMESSDCAAALDPSIFDSQGGRELRRFLKGAAVRGETALLINALGNATGEQRIDPLSLLGSSLLLPDSLGLIRPTRLPVGAKPVLAPDVGEVDRDLGLRLLNRASDAPWWALRLDGLASQALGGNGRLQRAPAGRLEPILVDALGAPVVAAWIPDSEDLRWYVIPGDPGWSGVLDWLLRRALPAFAPRALRRARSPHALDPTLQTPAEATGRRALEDLEATYHKTRRRLEGELEAATVAAESIRSGLLYGTGAELEASVQTVLEAAGLSTSRLDEVLGDTKSADLLITYEDERRLVEIKAASGNASEALVGHLTRHLATWPQIRPDDPVGGGVLVINHQHRLEPAQRAPEPYTRTEFVASLDVPVLATVQLYDWWRTGKWDAIRSAVLAHPQQDSEGPESTPFSTHDLSPDGRLVDGGGERGWLRGLMRRIVG